MFRLVASTSLLILTLLKKLRLLEPNEAAWRQDKYYEIWTLMLEVCRGRGRGSACCHPGNGRFIIGVACYRGVMCDRMRRGVMFDRMRRSVMY